MILFDNIFIRIFLVTKKIRKKMIKNIKKLKILNFLNIDYSFLILSYLKMLYIHFNTILLICQQKHYDKIRQITVDANIPATSAANAAIKIPLVFFIPTALV